LDVQGYHTIERDTEAEIIIQKSHFLCHARSGWRKKAVHFHTRFKKNTGTPRTTVTPIALPMGRVHRGNDETSRDSAGQADFERSDKNALLYTLVIVTRYFGELNWVAAV